MTGRLIVVLLIWALPASSQMTGKFYLDKAQFSPTEPIFVNLKITNTGLTRIELSTPDTGQPMCAGVSSDVYRDGIKIPSCFDFAERVCVINGGGWTSVHLMPGQSHTDHYLLNYRHEVNIPGHYRVESKRIGFPDNPLQTVEATLLFQVDSGAAAISSGEIQMWLNQLHSTDYYKRTEAARTLASIAPRSIESTLIDFAKNPESARYAPLALYRLHTPRSMQALTDLLKQEGPRGSESIEAAQYLARSGDQRWYPFLFEFAKKSPGIGYLTYAAELGGKTSIPDLVQIASTSVDFSSYGRSEAITALGSTHSRAAIPILLDFLQSGDEDTSDRASQSLRVLVHRVPFPDPQSRDHNLEVRKWSEWWKREGATARIYRDDECADPVVLP